MIYIGSFRDVRPKEYDEVWLIVRSLKNTSLLKYSNVHHVIDLSPSQDLFHKYLLLRQQGKWDNLAFETIYLPTFIHSLAHNDNARRLLNILARCDSKKRILLACFCPDQMLCHRSIIGALLYAIGVPVCSTTTDNAIKKYSYAYDMYKKEKTI